MAHQAVCVVTDLVYDIRINSLVLVFAHGFRLQLRLAATGGGSTGTGENSPEALKIGELFRRKNEKSPCERGFGWVHFF
jgi:hypothetical protein